VTGAQPAAKTPAIALLDSGDAPQWQNWTKELGWQVIAPTVPAGANIDVRIQAVEAAVEEAIAKSGVDPARVYMAGLGEEGSAVFYAISRVPDLWAAGLALGGSPQAALDTNHIYASNFTLTPVLWAGNGANDQALAAKLQSAGANLEFRTATTTMASVFEWLARHTRQEFPASIDCETNSPVFARCSWIRMTKFDLAERNDVLPTTLIPGGTGAALDLGAFGYANNDPGPGLLVVLPAKYSGPLKPGDRIVALDGKPIADTRTFAETMAKLDQERAAAVIVQRGKERVRLEGRIVLPKRDPGGTVRVQAQYIPEDKEIQIVSRGIIELRVTVPEAWVPGGLYWNGLALQELKTPGCLDLSIEKELLRAAPCAK
jgi:predicted esterase